MTLCFVGNLFTNHQTSRREQWPPTNTASAYNAARHRTPQFTVKDGGFVFVRLLEWRAKRGREEKKTRSSVMAKIINEALVDLGAAAGGGSVALGASSCRTQTKPHSSPK